MPQKRQGAWVSGPPMGPSPPGRLPVPMMGPMGPRVLLPQTARGPMVAYPILAPHLPPAVLPSSVLLPPPTQPPPPPPPPLPLPMLSANMPQLLGRRAWEQALADALQKEEQYRALSLNKNGVSLRVFWRGREDTSSTSTSGAPVSDEWSEDNRLPVDLGVVPIMHHAAEDEQGEEEEEVVPKGYEDAPPVLLPTALMSPHNHHHHHLGGHLSPFSSTMGVNGTMVEEGHHHHHHDGGDYEDGRGQGEDEEEDEEQGPSCRSQLIKISNTSPFGVTVSEVTILPQDKADSKVWLEVRVGSKIYSSREGEAPRHQQEEVVVEEEEQGGAESGDGGNKKRKKRKEEDLVILPHQSGGESIVHVSLYAEQDAEVGCVAKWVLLHFQRPSLGFVFDSCVHTFLLGRRVIATVADETAQSMLNVEARPFIPRELREFFDVNAKALSVDLSSYRPYLIDRLLARLPGTRDRELFRLMYKAYKDRPPPKDPHNFFLVPREPGTMGWSLAKYVEVQRTLLNLEELQAETDIRTYDLFNLTLTINPRQALKGVLTTQITVPGASEQRPHLAFGDVVRLRPSKPFRDSEVDGAGELLAMVLKTKEDRVTLLLPSSFPIQLLDMAGSNSSSSSSSSSSSRFHCRFSYNETDFRVLHNAIDSLPQHTERLLFPKMDDEDDDDDDDGDAGRPVPVKEDELSFVHSMINKEQKQAVLDVVNRSHGKAPYIVHGPPGTGKTLTVIEAIMQVCRVDPRARVLACAPSDTAADIICDRLAAHMDRKQLFRLNWWQRKQESMPPRLLAYSCWDSEASVFTIPPNALATLRHYQVIVSTCASAGLLSLLAKDTVLLPPDGSTATDHGMSFTHIFVDESSQAQQPEVLVPIALSSPNTSLVLSGDPKQLGPTIRSHVAQALGLGRSLQEHIMMRDETQQTRLYDTTTNSLDDAEASTPSLGKRRRQRCITALRRNYRSHRDIIEVPSRLFYDGKLLECGDAAVTTSMMEWELLGGPSSPPPQGGGGMGGFLPTPLPQEGGGQVVTTKRCPLLFYGVVGEDYHELDSPSFFNPLEASKIAELVQALLTSRRVQCKTSDVGIISAFRKQVLKLRSLLRQQGLGTINTGQVEDFQGQEQKVIIISTVLSSNHPSDVRQNLGFLGHPKRFNVAVTRSKALTVIVGNPYVLAQDPCWKALLEFCVENGAYKGCACPLLGVQEEDDLDNVLDAVAQLSLLGPGSSSSSSRQVALPDDLDSYTDSGWRIML